MLAERDAKIRELEETIKMLQSKLQVCEARDDEQKVANGSGNGLNHISEETEQEEETIDIENNELDLDLSNI